jgi:hypothetical protein
MRINFNDAESGNFTKYEAGKRYHLVVQSAEEGTSAVKGTPFIKLNLVTETGVTAYDHVMYITPKALHRAQEWFKALGLPDSGEVDFDPDRMEGIHLTAECYLEPYTVNQGTAEEKTYQNTKWCKPERVAIGAKPGPKTAAKPAPMPGPIEEEMPF